MIKIEKFDVVGWNHAIRGMRNPMNSWDKSDSFISTVIECFEGEDVTTLYECSGVGENDLKLMKSLVKAGSDHRKFMRMIVVYADVTAPMYWWKEFDTYKVGTVRNSCSTMHKIHDKEFTLDDFSCEMIFNSMYGADNYDYFQKLIDLLNINRKNFIEKKDNIYWWQMIQLLPSSYNQKSTVMLNYEVLANMYHSRKGHKLNEWREFCSWIECLPYSELITGGDEE